MAHNSAAVDSELDGTVAAPRRGELPNSVVASSVANVGVGELVCII